MFVSVNDHLFLALDRITEQLDKFCRVVLATSTQKGTGF